MRFSQLRLVLCLGVLACNTSDVEVDDDSDAMGEVTRDVDAGRPDAAVPMTVRRDAGRDAAAPPRNEEVRDAGFGTCGLGAVRSAATDQQLDVLGNIVYYLNGQTLPAGRYQVKYTGGCFKFNFLYNWSVQAGDATRGGWFLVGESTSDRLLKLPGTGEGMTIPIGYPSFQACVEANLALPAVEIDFSGGKLGVWLDDAPYFDNVTGEGGDNPAWQLTLLTECPPDIVFL